MKITVELPDDVAKHADPGREALEALAIEGYRSGTLTHYQADQIVLLGVRLPYWSFPRNPEQ
jgi:hypothetical protein